MTEPTPGRPLAERRPELAVAPGDLRLTCDESCFDFTTTAEVAAAEALLDVPALVERGVETAERETFVASPLATTYGRTDAVGTDHGATRATR